MAVVSKLVPSDRETFVLQPTTVTCRYKVFESEGRKVLQLDTFGSKSRKFPEKVSQTLQFDERRARELWKLLTEGFDF